MAALCVAVICLAVILGVVKMKQIHKKMYEKDTNQMASEQNPRIASFSSSSPMSSPSAHQIGSFESHQITLGHQGETGHVHEAEGVVHVVTPMQPQPVSSTGLARFGSISSVASRSSMNVESDRECNADVDMGLAEMTQYPTNNGVNTGLSDGDIEVIETAGGDAMNGSLRNDEFILRGDDEAEDDGGFAAPQTAGYGSDDEVVAAVNATHGGDAR